jgi:hypothetical protein
MMKQDDEEHFAAITLETIANGEAELMFQRELQAVLDNISDEDTELKKERKVILEVCILPSVDRSMGSVTIKCGAKLAPKCGAMTALIFRKEGRKNVGFEPKMRQGNLFDAPSVAQVGKD